MKPPRGGSPKPPSANDYGEQDENGVDLSLLRYMLRLSPLERLRVMERHARDTELLYEYGRRHREAKAAGDHLGALGTSTHPKSSSQARGLDLGAF